MKSNKVNPISPKNEIGDERKEELTVAEKDTRTMLYEDIDRTIDDILLKDESSKLDDQSLVLPWENQQFPDLTKDQSQTLGGPQPGEATQDEEVELWLPPGLISEVTKAKI